MKKILKRLSKKIFCRSYKSTPKVYFKYSLETIPMILFSKIIQNKDLSLLTNEKEMSEEKLQELWNNIRKE